MPCSKEMIIVWDEGLLPKLCFKVKLEWTRKNSGGQICRGLKM
jgi:hypothetical protein